MTLRILVYECMGYWMLTIGYPDNNINSKCMWYSWLDCYNITIMDVLSGYPINGC